MFVLILSIKNLLVICCNSPKSFKDVYNFSLNVPIYFIGWNTVCNYATTLFNKTTHY